MTTKMMMKMMIKFSMWERERKMINFLVSDPPKSPALLEKREKSFLLNLLNFRWDTFHISFDISFSHTRWTFLARLENSSWWLNLLSTSSPISQRSSVRERELRKKVRVAVIDVKVKVAAGLNNAMQWGKTTQRWDRTRGGRFKIKNK